MATVCLPVLVLNWAIFYAMLASFVPEVPGAMCIYGVTRIMPGTTFFIQFAGPIVIFVLGTFLLLEHAPRQSGIPGPSQWVCWLWRSRPCWLPSSTALDSIMFST